MELWDLYDIDGNRTGETIERSSGCFKKIPNGMYHMVCDILVQHIDGTFLLTKRHPCKDVYPGYWEASAGGSAVAGESPIECAKRELFEETGIKSDSFELVGVVHKEHNHSVFYSYLVVTDWAKDSIVLQEGETTDYKWVDKKELIEHVDSEESIKTHNERLKALFNRYRAELTLGVNFDIDNNLDGYKNILLVNACVREESRTRKLAEEVLQELGGLYTETKPQTEVSCIRNEQFIIDRTNDSSTGTFEREKYFPAYQFAEADVIVIAAPYWDLSFPAVLKAYFEKINVLGITFKYSSKGIPIGLCKAKKLIYVTTAGGPIISDELGFGYVKALAQNFYGIKDVSQVKKECLDI